MIAAIEAVLGSQYNLQVAETMAEARKALTTAWPDLLLLDLRLPDGSGVDLLREAREADPKLEVIVITGSQDIGTAVQVMKLGAQDYLQKPFSHEDLLLCIQQAFERWRLKSEVSRLRSELYEPFHWGNIVSQSPATRSMLEVARKMAQTDTTVLITGESGVGKDLIARAIHCEGKRADGPFVAVNCVKFSTALLESELFGHEKGAFTGATSQRRGRFELADGGTLFLDEIGNTTPEMQAHILRTVETKQFERVGGEETLHTDFRLITATNTDLEAAVRERAFREDLYYRLNVVRIEVPPLRDRPEDIVPLCSHFLARLANKTAQPARPLTPEALNILKVWHWPGNIRELQNLLEMASVLEDGDWITSRHFPVQMRAAAASREQASTRNSRGLLEAMMEDYERMLIEEQLRVNGWNQVRTAQSLGIHRNTIDKKIKKYGLTRPTVSGS